MATWYSMRVACPWFEPTEPLGPDDGPSPARSPLGVLFDGRCAVTGARPELAVLREPCNFGYGRGRCSSFPAGAEADAVRFSSDAEGKRVVWVLEKEYAPMAHGVLHELASPPDAVVRQAGAYLQTCRTKT